MSNVVHRENRRCGVRERDDDTPRPPPSPPAPSFPGLPPCLDAWRLAEQSPAPDLSILDPGAWPSRAQALRR